MNIDWKTRIKNKMFWLALIPAVLLLAQVCAAPFGYTFDFANLGAQLTAIVNALFAVLAIIGVVADPTTPGITDGK
jgi:phi LC3 family holin